MKKNFIMLCLLLMGINLHAKNNIKNKSTIYTALTTKNGLIILGNKEGLKVLNNKHFKVPTFKAKKNMSIYAIAAQEDGKIIIGGNFDTVNGHKRKDIVRLNTDGSVDEGFMSDFEGFNGEVYAIEVLKDKSILVGGYFTTLGNNTISKGLVKLHENGAIDVQYTELNHYLISIVNDIYMVKNKVFIAGIFIKDKQDKRAILSVDTYGNMNKIFNKKTSIIQGNAFKIAGRKNHLVLVGDLSVIDNKVVADIVKLNIDGIVDKDFHLANLSGFMYDVKYHNTNDFLLAGELFIENKGLETEANVVHYKNKKLIPLVTNSKMHSYTLNDIQRGD